MVKKKVVVLGGGISGLSAAWKLAENGFRVEVYEKESLVGGLVATIKKDDYLLDFGPHPFYTQDFEISDTFKELIGENLLSFERNCLLFFHNTYIHYPPRPSDVLFHMGFKTSICSSLSYAKTKIGSVIKSGKNETFEDWAIKSFGKYLYKIFFEPYTRHFWKLSPNSLAADWADARVAQLTLLKTVKLLFFKGKVGDQLNQIERDTLPLFYPEYGCGMLPERIAERVRKCGGQIFLNSFVKRINLSNLKKYSVEVISEQVEKELETDILISTIPLKSLVNSIRPSPDKKTLEYANSLKSMGLIVLFLVVKKRSVLPVSYVYCFDRIYHRVTEYNKFSEKLSPRDENLLSVEISCYEGDQYWNTPDEEISELCIKDLIHDGYLKREQIKTTYVLKSNSAYPVYLVGYHEPLHKMMKYLQQYKDFLYLLGRNGSFNYMDQDQAMRAGFDLANKIIENHCHTKKR